MFVAANLTPNYPLAFAGYTFPGYTALDLACFASGLLRQGRHRRTEGPLMLADERHQIAARIAQKLRDADVGCEIVALLHTDAAVLRRDSIVVALALILLSGLA